MWQTDTVREGLDQIPDTKARAIAGQLKQRLAALYGDRLVHVILYGSRARGDSRPYSDVDVLVVLKGPIDGRTERERTLDAVAELSLKHDTVVHRVIATDVEYTSPRHPFIETVQREGILV
jgi:predicted nucleotidyltransferase